MESGVFFSSVGCVTMKCCLSMYSEDEDAPTFYDLKTQLVGESYWKSSQYRCSVHSMNAECTTQMQSAQHGYKVNNTTAECTAWMQSTQHRCSVHDTDEKCTAWMKRAQYG